MSNFIKIDNEQFTLVNDLRDLKQGNLYKIAKKDISAYFEQDKDEEFVYLTPKIFSGEAPLLLYCGITINGVVDTYIDKIFHERQEEFVKTYKFFNSIEKQFMHFPVIKFKQYYLDGKLIFKFKGK